MRTILIASLKGGTGKSTVAVTLCQYLAHRKKKALLIDLDGQGDATFASGAVITKTDSAVELLKGEKITPQRTRMNYDVIPGRFDLNTFKTETGSALLLRKAMKQFEGKYDVVVIDAPPTVSQLLYCGICASDEMIIPTRPSAHDFNSISGMFELLDVFKKTNTKLKVDGIVMNCYSPKTLLSRKVYQLTEEEGRRYGVPVLGAIREATAVRESGLFRTSLFDSENENVKKDFIKVFESLDL